MASRKMKPCKICGQQIAKSAKVCPYCGAKQKKSKLLIILIVLLVLFVLGALGSGGSDDNKSSKKVGNVSDKKTETEAAAAETEPAENPDDEAAPEDADAGEDGEEAEETEAEAPEQEIFKVGDILDDNGMKIVYAASGEYKEDNEFVQPAEGNKYIFLKMAFINESDSDKSISFYSFECYADGYNAEMYYGGEEDLSATLSAGRSTEGYLYFEVPEDAKDIEVEYESNFFTDEKIRFLYEGEQDSGFVLEKQSDRTDGALAVGDTVEESDLRITYLSCEKYDSSNMFIEPKKGCTYYSLELEFENLSGSDQSISTLSFDCYADGINCEQTFVRDDDLSATISAGRKAKGTVTFEIPDDAEVMEAEFNDNFWTSHRIVFTVR